MSIIKLNNIKGAIGLIAPSSPVPKDLIENSIGGSLQEGTKFPTALLKPFASLGCRQ